MLLKLIVLFVLVPWLELTLLFTIGARIGLIPTLAIIVLTGVSGAWLARGEGAKTWRRIHEGLGQGRLPTTELVEGFLVLVAGLLLLTPGFLTDAVGFSLLIPSVRGIMAAQLIRHYARTIRSHVRYPPPGAGHSDASTAGPDQDGEVIEGRALRVEDVDDE